MQPSQIATDLVDTKGFVKQRISEIRRVAIVVEKLLPPPSEKMRHIDESVE